MLSADPHVWSGLFKSGELGESFYYPGPDPSSSASVNLCVIALKALRYKEKSSNCVKLTDKNVEAISALELEE